MTHNILYVGVNPTDLAARIQDSGLSEIPVVVNVHKNLSSAKTALEKSPSLYSLVVVEGDKKYVEWALVLKAYDVPVVVLSDRPEYPTLDYIAPRAQNLVKRLLRLFPTYDPSE